MQLAHLYQHLVCTRSGKSFRCGWQRQPIFFGLPEWEFSIKIFAKKSLTSLLTSDGLAANSVVMNLRTAPGWIFIPATLLKWSRCNWCTGFPLEFLSKKIHNYSNWIEHSVLPLLLTGTLDSGLMQGLTTPPHTLSHTYTQSSHTKLFGPSFHQVTLPLSLSMYSQWGEFIGGAFTHSFRHSHTRFSLFPYTLVYLSTSSCWVVRRIYWSIGINWWNFHTASLTYSHNTWVYLVQFWANLNMWGV